MQQISFADQRIPERGFLLFLLIASAISLVIFLRYTGLSRGGALLTWTVTIVSPLFLLGRSYGSTMPVSALAAVVFIFTAVPFVLRFYSNWRNQQLTEQERLSGAAGLRAWFSPANILMAIIVSVSGSMGFGWSLPLLLLLTVGSLALWPALNPAPAVNPPEPGPSNLSAEREKVLSLLEAGKISAEESAELLNALGSSMRAATVAAPPSRGAKLTLIGAAVVFLGFLFPWFELAPIAEASKLLSSAMPPGLEQQLQGIGASLPQFPSGPIVRISGPKVADGLGWIALVTALAAALLPHFAQAMHRGTLNTMRLVALGVSSGIMIYLAAESPRHVAFGLVITVAGLFLEWMGLLRDEAVRIPAAMPVGTEIPSR